MDYDDNDFQSQNLHIAGEGSSKFSPVLRPYALPKFDFDDGLHGNLRFDSLVENEVFLGIPSQEDNQWIKDFSRGSSGIEFSSGTAETCSISRRKNVWSEATSSESVEMLLKSVGQEEMVREETVIEESDAGDELGSLTNQMESNLNHDRMEDVIDSQPALLPDEFAKNFSGLNESAGCKKRLLKFTPQTSGAKLSGCGTSSDLDPNAVSEKAGLLVIRENLGIDRKFDDANQVEVGTSVVKSMNCKIQEESGVQANNIDTSSANVVSSTVELSSHEIPPDLSATTLENTKDVLKFTDKAVAEDNVSSKEVNMDDQILRGTAVRCCSYSLDSPLCVDSKVECVERRGIETCMTNLEETSSLLPKGCADLKTGKDCNEDVCSTDPTGSSKAEVIIHYEGRETNLQFKSNVYEESSVMFPRDNSVEGHVVEVSNAKPGKFSIPALKIESPMQIVLNCSIEEKSNLLRSDIQMNRGVSVSGPEAATVPEVDNDHFRTDDGGCTSHLVDLASFAGECSSGKLHKGKSGAENVTGGNDAIGVQVDPKSLDSVSSPFLVGSVQMCKENIVSDRDDGNYTRDVPSPATRNANLRTETGDVEEIDKTVGTLSLDECIKANVVITDGSKFDDASVNRRALEDTNLASSDILNGAPPHSGNGSSGDEVVDNNEEQKSPLLVGGPTQLEKKKEMEVEVPAEVNLSTLKKRSQVATDLGSVSEGLIFAVGKRTSPDCAAPTHNETIQSVSMVETCNTDRQSKQAVMSNAANQEGCEDLEVYRVPCEPCVKEGDGPAAVTLEKHKETTKKNHEAAPLKVSAGDSADHQSSFGTCSSVCDANRMLEGGRSSVESDKPSCDSPTVFSFTGLTQTEKEKQKGLKGGVVGNVSPSNVSEEPQSSFLNLKEKDVSKEEKSFTFEVNAVVHLSEGGTSKIMEVSPLTSGVYPVDPKMAHKISRGSPQGVDGGIVRGGDKETSERKTRRASGKASLKENPKKGNNANETSLVRRSGKGNKSHSVSISPSGTGLKPYGNVEGSGVKPADVISIPSSNLPELNTSSPSPAFVQQPFTDLQQVQLRAQILVYGSLIQGAAPDEACMISAFGSSDGGRSLWESAWSAFVQRLHGQKSHANYSETPVQLHPGARVPDQAPKQSSLKNKALPSTVGRASSKGTPSPVVNTMKPLSSPLWNISPPCDTFQSSGIPRGTPYDYNQAMSPLHSFQTPSIRNFSGHNNSWLSQAPFPGPWVASPQISSRDFSARLSALPFTETVKLTPVLESSVPVSSGVKHVEPIPAAQSGNPSVHVGTSSPLDVKKVAVSPGQHSADPKTRKRKKVSVPEDHGQISLLPQTQSESMYVPVIGRNLSKKVSVCEDIGQVSLLSQTQTGPVCVPFVTGHFSTAVSVTAPSGKVLTAVSPASSLDHPKGGDQNVKKVTISGGTFCKIEEGKLQAEDAAAQAVAAVSQCEGVWSQLDKQRNSGVISDVEAKLASAAVAIAAAASVAKAAAAAAKMASNAASQAKLMADEALVPSGTGNATDVISHPNVVSNLGKATPVSILKGGDGSNSSSSIIVAAREAAKRRVEAASNASRHAENLDAIVKAAELAAAAVSQAGTIAAMGKPIPLRELVEAGPEGYWRVPQVSVEHGVKLNNVNRDQVNVNSVEESPSVSARQSKEAPLNQEMQTENYGMPLLPREVPRDLMDDNVRVVDGISDSVTSTEKDSRVPRGRRASGLVKTIGVVPESDGGLGSTSVAVQNDSENAAVANKDNDIKEGCLVEVFRDDGDVKAAWFAANVLSLRDGKAFVSFTNLQIDEGSGQLKEWVPLEGEGEAEKSPRIRIPHPMTSVWVDGTGKRGRAAIRDNPWSVGDRVDVLMQDCWREGVVKEANEKDETTLTVHFPAQGETSVVRVWHLRPTLLWKDGKWIEWSILRDGCSLQGDTPQEKRRKLGSPVIDGKAKDKMLKNFDLVVSKKHEESRLLPLAADENIFNVGKNASDDDKPGALRKMMSGLQKEGSRVILGVPKPGRKRKFMEVSKHYVADWSNKKNNLADDPVKLSNYLMPQGQGSRGWKNNSKIDAKDKKAAVYRPKVLKSGKSESFSDRTLPPKDNVLATHVSAPSDATITDVIVKHAISNEENVSGQQNLKEFGSFPNTEEETEAPILFSSLALPPDAPLKKGSTSNAKFERQNKGKLDPARGKSCKVEVKDKSIPEVVETRRSNRRIQPTSRLLEGLQSSLVISKIPSASHDRSHKSQNREGTTSKGN